MEIVQDAGDITHLFYRLWLAQVFSHGLTEADFLLTNHLTHRTRQADQRYGDNMSEIIQPD